MTRDLLLALRYLAPLLPPLTALALWGYVRRRRRAARALGEPAAVRRLLGEDLQAVPWPRVLLVLLAAALLAAALADPLRSAADTERARGGQVVLVLDASNSMLARDAAPSRLEQERAAARAIVRGLAGVPVGLVVFAGRAYVLSPPTQDHAALELFLDALDPQIVTQTGSSLSAAIRQGARLMLAGQPGRGARTMLLASDGDALEDRGGILEAAKAAASAGVVIHTLGTGTPAGAPVPEVDPGTGRVLGHKRDPRGGTATSRLDAGLLRDIADAAGGQYLSLGDADALRRLRERVGSVGPAREGDGPRTRYAWLVGVALLCLAAELAASHRPREVT